MLTATRVNVQNSEMPRRLALLLVLWLVIWLAAACGGPAKPTQPAPRIEPPSTPSAPEAPVAEPAESAAAQPAPVERTWPLPTRVSPVEAAHAMIVSSHRLATEVGVGILERGGNAVDASVAVAFALAVVHPVAGNIGGGGFMIIRMHDGVLRALDFREAAPAAATPDMYVDSSGNVTASSVTGPRSVGVPGTVAGLYEAHRRFGRLPWGDVLAPAIHLAAEGHVIDPARSRQIALEAARLAQFPASAAQFLVNGTAPPPGTHLVQTDLARTLQVIADSGPRVFYRGGIAARIVQEMQRGGGLITPDDLARYRAKWRAPVQIGYRGYTIYTMPPPSGGGVTLAEILNVMEGYSPLPAFGSAALLHLEAEAMRRAYLDRNAYLGDPDMVQMPLERLLSKSYATELRAGIDPQRASPSPARSGTRSEGTETTHLSVVDADGNAVSCTTTLNNDFGSAVTVTGAGFVLNDEMDDFTSAPGRPNLYGLVQGPANVIAPGKRMLSAMTPSLVLDSTGALLMVLGSPGGSRITTAVYQVISNVIDHHLSLAEAVAAPRLHDQALPDMVYVERGGFAATSTDSLVAMGHQVTVWGYKTEVNAIERTATGWVGVADPRRAGAAAGY
jgi:gamma-glutamyltranspeptidase / glutathione hydrolase